MDYYSQYPCPPEDIIITEVLNIMRKKYISYCEVEMKNIIKEEFDLNGGISSMGSATGYQVFGKKDLVDRVNNRIIKKNMETMVEKSVEHMMNVLQDRPDLKHFVKHFDNKNTGFMFCDDPIMNELIRLTDDGNHSGASFAHCLRRCQQILN